MNYIKHLPLALFTAFCLKHLVLSTSYIDILFLVVLAGASCFFEFCIFNKQFQAFKDEFELYKNENNLKFQELNDIKSSLVGIKLGQSIRGTKIG